MSSHPDPITAATESGSEHHVAQGVDTVALHRRLDQLHRAMGFQDAADSGSEPSGRRQPPNTTIDVLAALKAPPVPSKHMLGMPRFVWMALPFVGLLAWWWIQNPQPSTKVAEAPPVQAPVQAPPEPAAPPAPVVVPAVAPPVVAAPAEPGPEALQAAQEDAVRQRIESWRQAWAGRNVEAYLSHYSEQFKPLKEATRAEWAANRRRVISSRPDIVLSVDQLQLQRMDDQRWRASFLQDYASGGYIEKQQPKTLELVQENGQWFIVTERQTP